MTRTVHDLNAEIERLSWRLFALSETVGELLPIALRRLPADRLAALLVEVGKDIAEYEAMTDRRVSDDAVLEHLRQQRRILERSQVPD